MRKLILLFLILTLIHELSCLEMHEVKLGMNCTINQERKYCGDELLCINSVCQTCVDTTQCKRKHFLYKCLHTYTYRHGVKEKHGICTHKNLFPLYSIFDGMATLFAFIGGAFSSVSGIGGGGLFVPIFTTIGEFKTSLAVPLSKATIFGGAICSVLILLPKKSPSSNFGIIKKPLIDYDAALILEPFTLLGAVIGVYLNIMSAEWSIILLLIIVLTAVVIRTFFKGIQIFKYEKEEQERLNQDDTDKEMKEKFLPDKEESDEEDEELKRLKKVISPDKKLTKLEKEELISILKKEESFPTFKIMAIMIVWIVIFILSLLKGGHGAPSILGIQQCSLIYWGLVILMFPIALAIGYGAAFINHIKFKKKKELGYIFPEGEIRWNLMNSFVIPIFGVLAGIFAGMLGIGGGMIKGPLLLELGVKPIQSSATSLFMILFTSSITTAQFIILGRLPFDYGIYFIVLGFLAALLGQLLIGWIIRKYKKQSIIVFILTLCIFIAELLLVGSGIYHLIIDLRDQAYMGFQLPC